MSKDEVTQIIKFLSAQKNEKLHSTDEDYQLVVLAYNEPPELSDFRFSLRWCCWRFKSFGTCSSVVRYFTRQTNTASRYGTTESSKRTSPLNSALHRKTKSLVTDTTYKHTDAKAERSNTLSPLLPSFIILQSYNDTLITFCKLTGKYNKTNRQCETASRNVITTKWLAHFLCKYHVQKHTHSTAISQGSVTVI